MKIELHYKLNENSVMWLVVNTDGPAEDCIGYGYERNIYDAYRAACNAVNRLNAEENGQLALKGLT